MFRNAVFPGEDREVGRHVVGVRRPFVRNPWQGVTPDVIVVGVKVPHVEGVGEVKPIPPKLTVARLLRPDVSVL